MDQGMASMGSGILDNVIGWFGAEANRDFQRQMSNTSYQRSVRDLQAAGLNPMLAYGHGGASTPSGSNSPPSNLVGAVNSATDARLKADQQELIRAQIDSTQAQAENMDAQTRKTDAETEAVSNNNILFHLFGVEKGRAEVQNLLGAGDEIATRIQQMIQNIQTGKASASQSYADIERLKALTNNLKLDAAEKAAMAKLWDHIGEAGAAGKVALPMLQVLKSILGGK